MDPITGSLGVEKLISKERFYHTTFGDKNSFIPIDSKHGQDITNSDNDIKVERLARQVAEENEDSDINVAILEEVRSLFNEPSEGFPPSVKAALKSCISRQRSLAQCRDELFKKEANATENGEGVRIKTARSFYELEQYQISFLEASRSFRRAVLLFRQLIMGTRGNTTTLIFNGDHYYSGANDAAKEGDILVGHMRINTPRASNLTLIHNGDSNSATSFEQQPPPPSNTSLGQAMRDVLEKWSITFSAGVQEGKARWVACRGIIDTGCDGNWIKRDVLERSGTETEIRDYDGTPLAMMDASGNQHVVKRITTLTWYRNNEATSRTTDFFVIDTGPYEMLFGREFIHEYLETHLGEEFTRENLEDEEQPKTLLPGRLKRMTSGKSPYLKSRQNAKFCDKAESRQFIIDKATKETQRAEQEAQRRQEKMKILAERRSHLVPAPSGLQTGFVDTVSATTTGNSTPTVSSVANASGLVSTESASSSINDLQKDASSK